MPLIKVYHQRRIVGSSRRAALAKALSDHYSQISGSSPESIRVLFIDVHEYTLYIGTVKEALGLVRIVVEIRPGIDDEAKRTLLIRMYEAAAVADWASYPNDFETQLIETDERLTMIHGHASI